MNGEIMSGGADFENSWHPVMHERELAGVLIVNVARCELCNEPFQPDSSGRAFCSRSLCKEVQGYLNRNKRERRAS